MTVVRPDFPDHGSPFSREQERERKQAAILTAAAKLIDRDGVQGARLEDIAASLGLTKTSIGYYYPTKDDLAAEVFRSSCAFLEDALAAAAAAKGSAAQKLLRLFAASAEQWHAVHAGRRPYISAVHDMSALRLELRAEIAKRLTASVTKVNDMVSAWIDETGAPVERPEPATFFLLGVLDWMNAALADADPVQADAIARALSSLVANGLCKSAWRPAALPARSSVGEVHGIFDREARNKMKREAFLKAGARFFNRSGFGGVSLAEVAASLGVTRGAFYYHIPDKDELLRLCLDRTFSRLEDVLEDAESAEDALSAIDLALRSLVYEQAAGFSPLVRPGLASALPEAQRRRFATRLATIQRRFGDALAQAIQDGAAHELDVDVVEQILVSASFLNGGYTIAAASAFEDWRLSEDPYTASVDYLRILMTGLGPRDD